MQIRPFLEYLIAGNSKQVKALLIAKGYPRVGNPMQMYESALEYIHCSGDEALESLVQIHPDYQLILSIYQKQHPAEALADQPLPAAPLPAQKQASDYYEISFDMPMLLQFLGFLVLVWLTIKIFKD